jgi:hypothetical protein
MAKKPKPKPQPDPTPERRTWDQLDGDDDVTGADEAEAESPVEFLRKPKAPRKGGGRGKGKA